MVPTLEERAPAADLVVSTVTLLAAAVVVVAAILLLSKGCSPRCPHKTRAARIVVVVIAGPWSEER